MLHNYYFFTHNIELFLNLMNLARITHLWLNSTDTTIRLYEKVFLIGIFETINFLFIHSLG